MKFLTATVRHASLMQVGAGEVGGQGLNAEIG